MSVKTLKEPLEMSYEAFLEWAGEDTLAEWVDGKVVLTSPPSEHHQDLSDFLTALLRHFAEAHGLGKVRSAPLQMKLGPDLPGREPDLLFMKNENTDRIQKNRLVGPADLAIEIISPESRARDRGEKFYEYEQAGVSEYWLIDPDREQAEFYQLDARGIYELVRLENGVFESNVLRGLKLEPVWFWQEPLPPLLSILKLWQLV